MLLWATLMIATAASAAPAPASTPLTPERVFASPALSGATARGVAVSPDGRWVTWLKASAANQFKLDLWAAPIGHTGEPRLLVSGESVEPSGQDLTEAEKGRRERQRIAAVSGVVSYDWDQQSRRLLIPAGGGLYLADADTGAVTPLKTGGPGATDAQISPLGGFASYVRDQNLYVLDLASGAERAVTAEGAGPVSYGVAEFVAQEEMGRFTGYWWAPKETAIAFTRVDESPVEILDRRARLDHRSPALSPGRQAQRPRLALCTASWAASGRRRVGRDQGGSRREQRHLPRPRPLVRRWP
jgi:dipeptidyl-peptidase-4